MATPRLALAGSGRDLAAEWRRVRWRQPQWTLATAAVAAWLAAFATAAFADGPSGAAPAPHEHGVRSAVETPSHGASLLHMGLMVVAMMLPSILPAARLMALTGKWKRRQRGPMLFAVGYLTVWIAAVLAVAGVVRHAPAVFTGAAATAVALLIAALWELTIWKPRYLRACHRHRPVPPDGWAADRACVQRGTRNALSCIGSCWALMLPMVVASHVLALWLMMPLTALVLYQKSSEPGAAAKPIALSLVAAAVVVLAW